MRFKYCPECGNNLILKEIGDEGNIPFCTKCNKPYFDIFPTCIIVMVINEFNEVALLRQDYLSSKYYGFVSGYIKDLEEAEKACIREVKEEIGVTIEHLEEYKTSFFAKKDVLMIAYYGFCKKSELKNSKEVNASMWVDVNKAYEYIYPQGSLVYDLLTNYLKNKLLKS